MSYCSVERFGKNLKAFETELIERDGSYYVRLPNGKEVFVEVVGGRVDEDAVFEIAEKISFYDGRGAEKICRKLLKSEVEVVAIRAFFISIGGLLFFALLDFYRVTGLAVFDGVEGGVMWGLLILILAVVGLGVLVFRKILG